MRRLLLVFATIMLFSSNYAQSVRFGIFANPQLSWLNGAESSVEYDGVDFGFNFGFFMDNFFATNYAFNTGISINNTGGKLLYDSVSFPSIGLDSAKYNSSYKLTYIQLPVGLKFLSNEIGYTTFYAHLGFLPEFCVDAKLELDRDENIYNDMNLFNLSYYFGGGIEYSLGGSTAINIGLIYKNGFVDITDTKPNDKVTMSNIAFRAGLIF